MNDLKDKVLEATIRVFNVKGIKFTMDDIAKDLAISKKTIYTVFKDKRALMLEMVDYCFDHIKASEAAIMQDNTLNTLDKIIAILGVMPEGYRDINLAQLYSLRDKYPEIYQSVEYRLENGWEMTIALIEQGMAEGVIRHVSIPLVKTMLESTLESFFKRDILIRNHLNYDDALKEVVSIIVHGIKES